MPGREKTVKRGCDVIKGIDYFVLLGTCVIVVITEECSLMGNNDVLTGTTEYLTL